MARATLLIMGVMVLKIYKKNYVICRNPIYSSKYTLHDKQKQVFYSYNKNPGIPYNSVYAFPFFRTMTYFYFSAMVQHCTTNNGKTHVDA